MYTQDSFFTLSPAGRAGLVLLSAALVVAVFALARRLFRIADGARPPSGIGARLGIALALFWLFVWLSPQIYYLYYQTIFAGLPWQVVVEAPPTPAHLVDLLSFRARPTVAAHGRAALGWALVLYALAGPRRRPHAR